MDDVPANLPALLYAHKIQSKAASVGFDWDAASGAPGQSRRGAVGAGRSDGRRARGPAPCPAGRRCATSWVTFCSLS